jgi:hypothetical protein
MAQGSPLNAPLGTNNLLALVLQQAQTGRGDVPYVDTGEPTVTTVATTASTVVQINFPVNGAGNQPTVSRGAMGLILSALSTATVVGSVIVEAVDTTASTGGHVEVIGGFSLGPAGVNTCEVKGFASSLAAGTDAASGLTNVIGLRLTIAVTTTGGGVNVKFCAAGTP